MNDRCVSRRSRVISRGFPDVLRGFQKASGGFKAFQLEPQRKFQGASRGCIGVSGRFKGTSEVVKGDSEHFRTIQELSEGLHRLSDASGRFSGVVSYRYKVLQGVSEGFQGA